jgi:hypothetical protein
MLTRLLVEPLALRLARRCEAPEDHSCGFFAFVFSTDSLAGSDYVLLLSLLVVVHLLYVLLGTRANSDLQNISCMSFVVP